MKNQKCKYCGTGYKENLDIPDFLPEFMKEKIKFIPACDCLEKKQLEEMLEYEKRLKLERLENRIKKFKDISVADKKFREAKFDNSDLSEGHMRLAKKYAEKFIEKNGTTKGIIFFGNCGTGKTYASACIANHLMQNGKTVLTLSLGSYLNKLRQEWSEAEMDILKHVASCDMLIIDDLGTENKTSWVLEKIFNLIDVRYRTGKPMIVTTNLSFEEDSAKCEITKYFSIDGKDRIKDRIREICYPQRVAGASRRNLDRDEFMEFLK